VRADLDGAEVVSVKAEPDVRPPAEQAVVAAYEMLAARLPRVELLTVDDRGRVFLVRSFGPPRGQPKGGAVALNGRGGRP